MLNVFSQDLCHVKENNDELIRFFALVIIHSKLIESLVSDNSLHTSCTIVNKIQLCPQLFQNM